MPNKIEVNQNFEHNGFLIVVDWVSGDIKNEVYFRKWKGDEFIGMFRMDEDEFKLQIAAV